ncbi:MAG: TolC family protein [Terracidiphilus sp.]|jgi:outer membrane protein TolC
MQLFGNRVFEQQMKSAHVSSVQATRLQAGNRLRAVAVFMLALAAGTPSGFAQQVTGAGATAPDKAASELPGAPAPALTQPLNLRSSQRDFSKPAGPLLGDPINMYRPTSIPKASFVNSVRLTDLVKDGKIYLSLSDALALALENNYDIAIARYDLDIADTDILRTRTGAQPLGVPTGLVANTLSGSASTSTTGGGPGGTSGGAGGAGSGSGGVTFTTAGSGPQPESLEPYVSAALKFDRASSPSSSFFTGGTSTTNTYNFTYNQGFVTGTAFQFGFDNSSATSTNGTSAFSPLYSSSFNAQVTQHLLQGAGIWVNKRFIYQALNDRRIADSSFRQQILYTVNQVETIYWGLVQAYEDVQSKQRALEQSTKLAGDDRKQLEIGTVAPLQVVQDDSAVASDKQALISSQSSLNYQQQIIKQAIARNLNDPALSTAPVIPTDRVTVEEIPEEKQPVETLVQQAFQQSPVLEQQVLALRNDEITLKGVRNGLLPQVDIFGYLGGSGVAGPANSHCNPVYYGGTCPAGTGSYGTAAGDAFNNSSPDKGFGFNITIPIGNRYAQSVQARSLMEYRQAELHLEQLYTQIRMNVVNAQFALINDRAQVLASIAARDFQQQSVDAEVKKLHLGASTTANVLLQERSLATAEDNLIAANAQYAKDRAGLYQTLASTLQHYGINLNDAATGVVNTTPVVPGVSPVKETKGPSTTPPPAQ